MTVHRVTATLTRAALMCAFVVSGAAASVHPAAASVHPTSASPAPAWQATVTPTSGSDTDYLSIVTSGGCPASNVVGRMFGAGLPSGGAVVVGNTSAGVTPYAAFTMPLGVTMRDVIAEQPELFRPSGNYRLALTCHSAATLQSLGDYVTQITYTSSTTWAATQPVTTDQGPIASRLAPPTAQPVPHQLVAGAAHGAAAALPTELPGAAAQPVGELAAAHHLNQPTSWLPIGLAALLAALVTAYLWRTRRRPTALPLDVHPHHLTGVSS